MVGRSDHHDVARHLVELHNEKRDNSLDLAGLVRVATFLADGVELVEEQNAWPGPDVVAKRPESGIGLPEVTSYQRIVAHHEQWQRERLGDAFRERRLPIPRWTGEENPVARLHAVRAKDVGSDVLLDELLAVAAYRQGKDQVLQASLRRNFENRVPATRRRAGRSRQRRGGNRDRLQRAFQTVGHAVVAPRSLVRHERLNGRPQLGTVATGAGPHDRDEEVCLSHSVCVVTQLARVATA
jgi:hypothetical protein